MDGIRFEDYRPMIRKRARAAARRFGVEFEEVEAAGYELFAEALARYDAEQGSFSTFLWHRLSRLTEKRGVADKERRAQDLLLFDDFDPDSLPGFSRESFDAILEAAEAAISSDAQSVLAYFLSRFWETPGINRKPTKTGTRQFFRDYFGWIESRVNQAWDELGSWWTTGALA